MVYPMAVGEGEGCRETQRARVSTTAPRRSPHRTATRQLSETPTPYLWGA